MKALEVLVNGNAIRLYVPPIARINYDQDYDGAPDSVDNCLNVANPNQRDTNADGYGNICDPDLNNDGIVNNTDLTLMKQVFYTSNANADLNGDGYVNFGDLAILKSMFNKAPGPGAQASPPTVIYLHTDALGHLRLATNDTGQAVWSSPTDVFGDTPPNEDPDGDGKKTTINWRGNGLYADSETSLLYNGARYRNPKMNRFLTPDPRSVGEHVQRKLANLGMPDQSPLELNPYVAVGNNPLRYIDPDGLAGLDTALKWGLQQLLKYGAKKIAIDPMESGKKHERQALEKRDEQRYWQCVQNCRNNNCLNKDDPSTWQSTWEQKQTCEQSCQEQWQTDTAWERLSYPD